MIESIIAQLSKFFKPKQLDSLFALRAVVLGSFWTTLLFLLVIMAFLLGRLSTVLEDVPLVSMEEFETIYQKEKEVFEQKNIKATIVASSGGKKYYYVWCKGAENIKEKNKRYYNSEEDAKKAGLTLAGNCR